MSSDLYCSFYSWKNLLYILYGFTTKFLVKLFFFVLNTWPKALSKQVLGVVFIHLMIIVIHIGKVTSSFSLFSCQLEVHFNNKDYSNNNSFISRVICKHGEIRWNWNNWNPTDGWLWRSTTLTPRTFWLYNKVHPESNPIVQLTQFA